MRECGDCQLCCRLLPVHDDEPWRPGPPLHKPAGAKCPHQRHHKGCTVYGTSSMPFCCKTWNCRWLVGDDTADQSRPDRAHYVIDILPDRLVLRHDETGVEHEVFVVQIWIDPNHPEAVHDKNLRAYMLRRAQLDGMATLIRFDSSRSLTVFPPPMSDDGEWHERAGASTPGFKGLFR